jgi:site-specific DNA recombinase
MLRNPTYAGRRHDSNGVTVHRCEPLVDAQTFKRAGEALAGRPKRGPATGHTALLTGFLHCSECGGPMYRISTRDGLFYRCSADPKFGAARKSECRNMVPLEYTDQLARAALSASPVPVTERVPIAGENHEAEIEQVKMELRELPARELDEDTEDAERARLRAEKRRLEALPSTPDRWQDEPTGETYGQMFDRLASDQSALRAAMRGKVTFAVHKRDLPMIGFRTTVHSA